MLSPRALVWGNPARAKFAAENSLGGIDPINCDSACHRPQKGSLWSSNEHLGNYSQWSARGPFQEWFFHHNSNSMEISFCSHPSYVEVIAIKFCKFTTVVLLRYDILQWSYTISMDFNYNEKIVPEMGTRSPRGFNYEEKIVPEMGTTVQGIPQLKWSADRLKSSASQNYGPYYWKFWHQDICNSKL